MNILGIGGCGYIGSAIANHLRPGHLVDTVDLEWFGNQGQGSNDCRDYDTLTVKELSDYSTVFMVAAHSSVDMCEGDPYGAFENNVANFVRLLRKLEAIKVCRPKLIYASSSCVYNHQSRNVDETASLWPADDHLTMTKQTIDHYARQSDVEFYGLRLGSVNGWSPNLRTDLMINSMVLDSIYDKKVHVTNPNMCRPILGTRDLTKVIRTITNSVTDKRGIYNIASFVETIGEIGKQVADCRKVDLFVGPTKGGYDFGMSTDKFEKAYTFTFEDTVDSIVRELVTNITSIKAPPSMYAKGRSVNKEYKNVL